MFLLHYLFIYFWLRWVFVVQAFSSCSEQELGSSGDARTSRWGGSVKHGSRAHRLLAAARRL